MTKIAAPFSESVKSACLMEDAAAASTPHVGWFTINTLGFCKISLPITNFCKFPPESDPAVFWEPGVLTSNFFITFSAKALLFFQSMKPRETRF